MNKVLILIAMFITGFIAGCNAQTSTMHSKWHTVYKTGEDIAADKYDTIPSSILLSHKSPSFGHSLEGYCLYKDGSCSGKHLKSWHKRIIVIGPEYTIWGCKRRAAK